MKEQRFGISKALYTSSLTSVIAYRLGNKCQAVSVNIDDRNLLPLLVK